MGCCQAGETCFSKGHSRCQCCHSCMLDNEVAILVRRSKIQYQIVMVALQAWTGGKTPLNNQSSALISHHSSSPSLCDACLRILVATWLSISIFAFLEAMVTQSLYVRASWWKQGILLLLVSAVLFGRYMALRLPLTVAAVGGLTITCASSFTSHVPQRGALAEQKQD